MTRVRRRRYGQTADVIVEHVEARKENARPEVTEPPRERLGDGGLCWRGFIARVLHAEEPN